MELGLKTMPRSLRRRLLGYRDGPQQAEGNTNRGIHSCPGKYEETKP